MFVVLSIVVPVYNVEPYLAKCIESLLAQDIAKELYEIILVDDGSNDNGGKICDDYAARENNIRVFHQTNQGLSVARNTGILAARGTFIQFVDSDDYIESNVLSSLISIMTEYDLEVIRFRYRKVVEGQSVPTYSLKPGFAVEAMDGCTFLLKELGLSCYACQFLIKRDLILHNKILFKPGIIFEDTEWTPRLLQCTRRISSVPILVYNYLERAGSITQDKVEKVVQGLLSIIDDMKCQMETAQDVRWYKNMISHIVVAILTRVSVSLYDNRNYYLRLLDEKNIYPLSTFFSPKKVFSKIGLINLSPRLTCWLIHVRNCKLS